MSIGKSSINRVQKAEKTGASQIVTMAPDMESSTPITEAPVKKKPTRKPATTAKTRKTKETTVHATTVMSNPSPETIQAVRGESLPIGSKMPVHLL